MTPLPLFSFGLSATLVRLRNSGHALRQSSPFNPAYAQASGAAQGIRKSKPCEIEASLNASKKQCSGSLSGTAFQSIVVDMCNNLKEITILLMNFYPF
jgi:hypothetical protein